MAKKIFLLDDERDLTELTKSLLEFQGFEVSASNDPKEAITALQTGTYDAAVVDLMMTDMDGFTVIKTLRSHPLSQKLLILVLSAKKLSDDERKYLMEEGVRFIPKPFEPHKLTEVLKQSL